MPELPPSAAVVVVGGGIVGASVAYHLATAGVRPVVLIERGLFGSGSSSRAAGGIRQQFSSEVNVRLSIESVKFYQRFEQLLGIDVGFRQCGYLFLLTNGRDWKASQRNALMQRSLSVPVQLLDRNGIARLVPQLRLDDVLGATYCPTDGFADPGSAVEGFLAGARRAGAVTLDQTAVRGIGTDDGRVAVVQTAAGEVRTPAVVNCAGAFAASVGRMVGLELPVLPYRRQIYVTEPFDGLPGAYPMTIDFGTKFYFRREGAGVLMGMDDPTEPSGEDTATTTAFLERLIAAAVSRVPVLEQARVRTGWGGLYEVTPDHSPLLGETEVPGFYCACGFSGHGFMHAPAAGKVISELITRGASEPDVSELSPLRLAEGRAHHESAVI